MIKKLLSMLLLCAAVSCASAQAIYPWPQGYNTFDVNGGIQISGISSGTPPPGLSYGLFPYGGIGLGIFSGAISPNQGIGIWTSPGGTPVEVMRILSGGNVGIGTLTPDTKLAVNGVIHAREVKVDLKDWPDYVFQPQYQLSSLQEVKSYIRSNQHLPDMPSAAEIEGKGLNLGDMNKMLTRKVEELTLYLIEKDTQVNTLKDEVKLLQKNQEEQLLILKELLKQLKSKDQ